MHSLGCRSGSPTHPDPSLQPQPRPSMQQHLLGCCSGSQHTPIPVCDPNHDPVCKSTRWAVVQDPRHTRIQVCDPNHDPVCKCISWGGGEGGAGRATPQSTSPALSKVSQPSAGSPSPTLQAFEILSGRASSHRGHRAAREGGVPNPESKCVTPSNILYATPFAGRSFRIPDTP